MSYYILFLNSMPVSHKTTEAITQNISGISLGHSIGIKMLQFNFMDFLL
jgi:hypothetical protein